MIEGDLGPADVELAAAVAARIDALAAQARTPMLLAHAGRLLGLVAALMVYTLAGFSLVPFLVQLGAAPKGVQGRPVVELAATHTPEWIVASASDNEKKKNDPRNPLRDGNHGNRYRRLRDSRCSHRTICLPPPSSRT